jgi:5-methylcytosine-specific restriction endonuclease McrA
LARRRQRLSAAELRRLVERRARKRCEYCHAPMAVCGYRFHVEHIALIAEGGSDAPENRALACASCNLAKTDKETGVDPSTGDEVPLFDPRTQPWKDHFRWANDKETLVGRTPVGRATVATLDMNSELRCEARRLWFETGWLP